MSICVRTNGLPLFVLMYYVYNNRKKIYAHAFG